MMKPQKRSTQTIYPQWVVQYLDPRLMCWKNEKGRYYDEEEAWRNCESNGRLVRFDRKCQTILER